VIIASETELAEEELEEEFKELVEFGELVMIVDETLDVVCWTVVEMEEEDADDKSVLELVEGELEELELVGELLLWLITMSIRSSLG